MLALEHISVSYGIQRVLRDVSWNLGTGERVALVGRNGTGKTTLFRVALSEQVPDDGVVRRAHHVRVGYLPQESVPLDGETVLDCALQAFDSALDAAREQEELQREIEETPPEAAQLSALLHRLDDLHQQFARADGFRMQAEAERVLAGLGFSHERCRSPLRTLSGGWRMRVLLARLLLARPTHLFLDEPTNHLDLPSLAWLEDFLQSYSGTLVVISHDRAFLDRVIRNVVELEHGELTEYAGNYSQYEVEKARRREALFAAKKNQDRRIAELERFVERFRAKNTKATQAKSKEKLLAKIERIEISDESESIHFHFEPAPRSGQVVVALSRVHKRFGVQPPLFSALDLEIERGEKIAIVGANGAGKSTLLRILAGSEPIDAGGRSLDDRAVVSFFAQHTTDGLDLNQTVFEELRRAAPRTLNDTRLRTLLGAFLFSGDEIHKRIGVLSGGEKARVAIAKTLVAQVNLLLLDEPTNHLDLSGKEMLAEALHGFDGTLVLVTHDRHVIDAVATRVLEVEMGGSVKSYLGGFTAYAEMRRREGRPLPGYGGQPVLSRPVDDPVAEDPQKPGELFRERKREERARVSEEKKLFARIEALDREKAALEQAFLDPALYAEGSSAEHLAPMHERHAAIATELKQLWARLETR